MILILTDGSKLTLSCQKLAKNLSQLKLASVKAENSKPTQSRHGKPVLPHKKLADKFLDSRSRDCELSVRFGLSRYDASQKTETPYLNVN